MNVQQAKDARELLLAGALPAMSIGYTTVKSDFVGGVRQLQEVKLFEVSLVAVPMNEAAVVTSVKSAQEHQAVLTALQQFKTDILRAIRERKGN